MILNLIMLIAMYPMILVVGYVIANGIAKATVATGKVLLAVADGKLNTDVDNCVLKRTDELGQMGNALENLIQKLQQGSVIPLVHGILNGSKHQLLRLRTLTCRIIFIYLL